MDKIANEFNKYFVNIGRLLSEQITSGHSSDEYFSKICDWLGANKLSLNIVRTK